jgi:thioredoxin-like negative regulator of GroEL
MRGSAAVDVSEVLEALADGRQPGRALLGLSAAEVDALVEQALFAAEHGRVDAGRDLLAALAAVEPQRPALALLLGHLEAERGALEAAQNAYAEAAARLGAGSETAPALLADIELARAEVELRLGDATSAGPRLERVRALGGPRARARAEALAEARS